MMEDDSNILGPVQEKSKEISSQKIADQLNFELLIEKIEMFVDKMDGSAGCIGVFPS